MTRSVKSVADTRIPPSAPAGMTAALSTMPPFGAFKTTVPGHGLSSGQAESHPMLAPCGAIRAKFSEYAAAAGTPQAELGTGILRATSPRWDESAASDGGPN